MKNALKYLWMPVVAIFLFSLVSCKKDEEETEDEKLSMSGELKYDLPSFVLVNDLRKLTAYGIKEPAEVGYRWLITQLYKDSLFGKSVIVRFPDSIGTFSVNCYAVAEGYYKVTKSGTTTTVDTSAVNNSLKGLVASSSFIVDPRDKKKYNTVKIGNLEWFAENLAWEGAGVPFRSAAIMSSLFGMFYTWNEATGGVAGTGIGQGPQGICPPGWSVPTNEDWMDFAKALNSGNELKFNNMWAGIGEKASADATFNGEKMWEYWPDNRHTNTYGWNAIPCGYSVGRHSSFEGISEYGMWWSSSDKDSGRAYYRYIYTKESNFPANYVGKNDFGMNVRCVKVASD